MSSTLEFQNITKTFPGVKALDDISFVAKSGEVTALIGENGAGKSTLLKVLNGDYNQDSGNYLLDGIERRFKTPQEAIKAGVSIIYQERQVVPALSVAENIFMEEIPVNKLGMIDFRTLNKQAQDIIDEFSLPIKASTEIRNLSVAHQQMVEIMKSYRRNPKIIAFDEPTASLSDAEIESLFKIIEKLKKAGLIILYVSHRMNEIFEITDQVVILKDGKFVEQAYTKDITTSEIIKKMVGRDLGDIFHSLDRNESFGEVILKAENLVAEKVKDVSFEIRAGEIVGFAGLVGAGRTEVMRTIFGADKLESGKIYLNGQLVKNNLPEDAISNKIALCPEDRKEEGIFAKFSVKENISVSVLNTLVKGGFLQTDKEIQLAEKGVEDLRIATPDIEKPIGELSGGNQQKAIFARWLATKPQILILDEPTKGIDVGSKSEIYQIICNLAKEGIGIILVSSELPEVLGVSDRIYVMCEGRITAELPAKDATDELILTYAMVDMLEGAI